MAGMDDDACMMIINSSSLRGVDDDGCTIMDSSFFAGMDDDECTIMDFSFFIIWMARPVVSCA